MTSTRALLAGATGMDELGPLEAQVDSLEVAVAENAELAVPLAGLVDALERDVAHGHPGRHARVLAVPQEDLVVVDRRGLPARHGAAEQGAGQAPRLLKAPQPAHERLQRAPDRVLELLVEGRAVTLHGILHELALVFQSGRDADRAGEQEVSPVGAGEYPVYRVRARLEHPRPIVGHCEIVLPAFHD